MSGIGLDRQPMREPLRAIVEIKQYFTGSIDFLHYVRCSNACAPSQRALGSVLW
jgi:hypothetical protein